MKRYRVVHRTGFKYNTHAVASYNEARMLPIRDENQIVFSSKLEIKPKGANFEFQDYFDTRVVFFEALEPHLELSILSDSLVELRNGKSGVPTATWKELSATISTRVDLTEYSAQTKRTAPPAELAKFVHKTVESSSPHEAAIAICKHIFNSVKYQHGVTGVHSIASEAWKKKVGVCQDFAHLALGALRAAGIPARYVSGYLHPQLEPVLHESVTGESHAWVEWFAGEWFAYDPTNDVAAQDRHIIVGRGRDYDDIAPLKGVFAGAEVSELLVQVEITREL